MQTSGELAAARYTESTSPATADEPVALIFSPVSSRQVHEILSRWAG